MSIIQWNQLICSRLSVQYQDRVTLDKHSFNGARSWGARKALLTERQVEEGLVLLWSCLSLKERTPNGPNILGSLLIAMNPHSYPTT